MGAAISAAEGVAWADVVEVFQFAAQGAAAERVIHGELWAEGLENGAEGSLSRVARVTNELVLGGHAISVLVIAFGSGARGLPRDAFEGGVDVDLGGFVIGPEGDAPDDGVGGGGGDGAGGVTEGDGVAVLACGSGEAAILEHVEPFDGHGDACIAVGAGNGWEGAWEWRAIEGEAVDGQGGTIGNHTAWVEDGEFPFGNVAGVVHDRDRFIEVGVEARLVFPAGHFDDVGFDGVGDLGFIEAAVGRGGTGVSDDHGVVGVEFIETHGAATDACAVVLGAESADHAWLRGPRGLVAELFGGFADLADGDIDGDFG